MIPKVKPRAKKAKAAPAGGTREKSKERLLKLGQSIQNKNRMGYGKGSFTPRAHVSNQTDAEMRVGSQLGNTRSAEVYAHLKRQKQEAESKEQSKAIIRGNRALGIEDKRYKR